MCTIFIIFYKCLQYLYFKAVKSITSITLWCAKNTFLRGSNTRILLPLILLKNSFKASSSIFFINTNDGSFNGLFSFPEYTMYCTLEKKTENTLNNFGVCTKAIYKGDMSFTPPQ